jgi:hypothetical protein
MSETTKRTFFLSEAKPYLNQIKPESRQFVGKFYLTYIDGSTYAIAFKFTDQWEVATCVKWMR